MKSYKLTINGVKYEARVLEYTGTHAKVNVNGNDFMIEIADDMPQVLPKLEQDKAVPMAPVMTTHPENFNGELRAPLPGVIVSIPVKEGDDVKRGQTIIIIEAMKMQSEIASPVDAKITSIKVKERSPVQEGDLMMVLDGAELKEKNSAKKPSKKVEAAPAPQPVAANPGLLEAPIPGVILDILVEVGQRVELNQPVLILEAMKMESEIHSTATGKIKKIHVNKGASVQEGDPLIELEV